MFFLENEKRMFQLIQISYMKKHGFYSFGYQFSYQIKKIFRCDEVKVMHVADIFVHFIKHIAVIGLCETMMRFTDKRIAN